MAERAEQWDGRPVVVAGAAVAGAAAAAALLRRGAAVTVVDRSASAETGRLAAAGATVVVGDQPTAGLFDRITDLVVSPGFAPHHPLVSAAHAAGVEVYSEPELAWRLRGPDAPPWLAVTGTNGKTTTVTMLAAILQAAGLRAAAVGNVGTPLVDLPGQSEPDGHDVLAVELSSQQLHWSQRLAPESGAMLNLAPDHLDWHGSFEAYVEAKRAIWRGASLRLAAAVGNLDDPRVAALLPAGGVGFTLAEPAPGQLGVVDGVLVDHAFGPDPVPLVAADQIRPAGAHHLANALAAAALARWYGAWASAVGGSAGARTGPVCRSIGARAGAWGGSAGARTGAVDGSVGGRASDAGGSVGVSPDAVRDGLVGYQPQPHRGTPVAVVAGVTYVDDSKATNPHAALNALHAHQRVVWIAGGQLKGVDVDDLVRAVAGRLAGAVLLGVDRAVLAQALSRHAPQVPVVEVARTDDGAMGEVVRAAATLAAPQRNGLAVVLLAPAAASRDMFASYAHRGQAFAAAVQTLGGEPR